MQWMAKRQIDFQIERLYFAGNQELPADMTVPPEWVRNTFEKLKYGVNPGMMKALKKIQADAKDAYSWGVFFGTVHAFENQSAAIIDRAEFDVHETFGFSEEKLHEFRSLLVKDIDQSEAALEKLISKLTPTNQPFAPVPTEQTKDFIRGYSKGLDFKIKYDIEDGDIDRNEILGLLWILWPKVEEFDNIPQLNRFLNANLKYQADPEAPPKRLEAICREIGLKLAPRGRPKKS